MQIMIAALTFYVIMFRGPVRCYNIASVTERERVTDAFYNTAPDRQNVQLQFKTKRFVALLILP